MINSNNITQDYIYCNNGNKDNENNSDNENENNSNKRNQIKIRSGDCLQKKLYTVHMYH